MNSDEVKKPTGINDLVQVRLENIDELVNNKVKIHEDVNYKVDINYLTHKQVARRRNDLFAKKILYQN